MPDLAKEIMQIIAEKMDARRHSLNLSDPLDELGLNSLQVVELTFDIEEKFDVQIPFDANVGIEAKTVADLIQSVEQLVAAKGRSA
jgi:acyl carrier protein